jgi:methanogenic corrinoid protein MtbC1
MFGRRTAKLNFLLLFGFLMQRMLSTTDFALAIGISESSARRMADSGEVEIHRTRGGHRRIAVAEAIRYVRKSGATIVRPELLGLGQTAAGLTRDSYNDRLLAALREGHSAQVTGLLQAMFAAGTSIAEIGDGPIRSAMEMIGQQYPTDRRSIFIEHRATAVCIRALHQLYFSLPQPDENAPEAIGASPSGDVYLIPSVLSALVVHEAGLSGTNLGPNTPLDVLADAIEEERPALAWLSISTPILSRSMHREIEKLAETSIRVGCRLVIGGRHSQDFRPPTELKITHCNGLCDLAAIAAEIVSALADEAGESSRP